VGTYRRRREDQEARERKNRGRVQNLGQKGDEANNRNAEARKELLRIRRRMKEREDFVGGRIAVFFLRKDRRRGKEKNSKGTEHRGTARHGRDEGKSRKKKKNLVTKSGRRSAESQGQ